MQDRNQVSLGQSFKNVISALDFIPSVKLTTPLSGSVKLGHTLLGCLLLLGFQLMPLFGIHFIERLASINLIFSSHKNLVALARNATLIAPFMYNMLLILDSNLFRGCRDQTVRGIRNGSILVGAVFRNVFIFVYRDLEHNAVLLVKGPLMALVMVYILQNLLGSLAIIWVEEYLDTHGIGGNYIMVYYQLLQLYVQVSSNPTPGNFGLWSISKALLLIASISILDKVYESNFTLTHVRASGVIKTVKFNPSTAMSTASLLRQMFKAALVNLISLIINPLLYLTQSYYGFSYERMVLIPDWFSEHMFFTQNYWMIPYMSRSDRLFYSSLIAFYWDTLFYLAIFHYLDYLDSQFNYKALNTQFVQSGLKVKNVHHTQSYVKQTLNEFKNNCLYIGMFYHLTMSFFNFYGVLVRSDQLVYYYGRFNSLASLVKEQEQLPEEIERIKHYL